LCDDVIHEPNPYRTALMLSRHIIKQPVPVTGRTRPAHPVRYGFATDFKGVFDEPGRPGWAAARTSWLTGRRSLTIPR
jgi:hypothetical protein